MLFRTLSLIIVIGIGTACSSENTSEDRAAIQAIMDRQVECWNQGDITCFMEGYWPSDSLMYIGGSGVTHGYQNALDRYRRSYPDQANMGTLEFQIVALERLAADAYHMVGKWALDREVGNINGHFTLLFRKMDGQWVIVKDHSSQTSL